MVKAVYAAFSNGIRYKNRLYPMFPVKTIVYM